MYDFHTLMTMMMGLWRPEIIEESNYYPFGLSQQGYNNLFRAIQQSHQIEKFVRRIAPISL